MAKQTNGGPSVWSWSSAGVLCAMVLTSATANAAEPATRPLPTLGTVEYLFAAISPDGKQVLTNELPAGNPSKVKGELALLWDLNTGRLIRRFEGHREGVNAGAFSPDGALLITAGGTDQNELMPSQDMSLRLWDVASGRVIREYKGHKSRVTKVCFSPDGKRVLSLAFLESARLWDVESGRELFAWPPKDAAYDASLSTDGSRALTVRNSPLCVWDAASGQEISDIPRPGRGSAFTAAHLSPDAKFVASASYDKTARVWDADTGKEVRAFAGHTTYVNQARFGADGKWLITASDDRPRKRVISHLQPTRSLLRSPHGP